MAKVDMKTTESWVNREHIKHNPPPGTELVSQRAICIDRNEISKWGEVGKFVPGVHRGMSHQRINEPFMKCL